MARSIRRVSAGERAEDEEDQSKVRQCRRLLQAAMIGDASAKAVAGDEQARPLSISFMH